ncbi:t-SNARE [Blyttiomyces helicus]|uniref:t-SNARE n=1 Tax=Blyttiomyces helicus TaxID=388810 RepID=A0A4P9VYG8_9FUNG|nr:t-SNARE [Blyttiomyces helicus]|eukprot:RKO84794.1 t-SNARE [Blyttiomyces helicus]
MARDRWADVNREGESQSTQHLQAQASAGDIEMGITGTDAFLQHTETISQNITEIGRNTVDLQGLHQRVISETSQNQAAFLTQQIDSLTATTSALISTTRNEIKSLSALRSTTDARVRTTQQKALARRLMTTAQDFQKVQQSAKANYRNQMQRQYRIAMPEASAEQIDTAIDSGAGSAFSQAILSSRVGEQRAALQAVQSRQEELRRIEQSITELFELFQEMQALLDNQQQMIDRIDADVAAVTTNVQDGSQQLTRGIVHAKSARKMKWIIFFVVLAVIIAIGVIIYVEVKK